MISCLDDNPQNCPPVAQVSTSIKRIKDMCMSNLDGMSPIVWWAGMCSEQQPQVRYTVYVCYDIMGQAKQSGN